MYPDSSSALLEQFTWEAGLPGYRTQYSHLIKHNFQLLGCIFLIFCFPFFSETTVTYILHFLALSIGHWSSVHFFKLFLFLAVLHSCRYFFCIHVQWSSLILNSTFNFHFRYIFLILKSIYFYSLFLLYIYAYYCFIQNWEGERKREYAMFMKMKKLISCMCNIIWSKIIFLWSFIGLHLFKLRFI